MTTYTVLQPFSFVRDGAAVHYTDREVGSVVELDDDQAKPLVAKGVLAAEATEEPVQHTERRRRSREETEEVQQETSRP